MPLIQLVIVLVVVGVILWVINSYIPNAGYHKENLECGSGYCCNFMAIECLRTHRNLSTIRIGKLKGPLKGLKYSQWSEIGTKIVYKSFYTIIKLTRRQIMKRKAYQVAFPATLVVLMVAFLIRYLFR